MQQIKALIATSKPKSAADYIMLARHIGGEVRQRPPESCATIRIALLSTFTITGIKEVLFTKCCAAGIMPDIYLCGYQQYAQEVLSPSSKLYLFNPDLVILFVDIQTLLGEQYLLPYTRSDAKRKRWVEEKFSEILSLVQAIKKHAKAAILLHNFNVPLHSPLGILENKQPFGLKESVESLNARIRGEFKKDPAVFVFDYDGFCSRVGKEGVTDYKMYYLADLKIDLQLLPMLSDAYLTYVKQIRAMVKKCLVLDLDNTLWGGILGEDGFEGIRLGPTLDGRPFMEFQKVILSLYHRGVILAINSKNNLDEVMRVFREHPYMLLKEKHFAAMRINWNDKVSNMESLAQELNIAMESFVFFDDDKINREIVKNVLPEVCVIDVPDDASLYIKTLLEFDGFNAMQLTNEDKQKGQMYVQQRKRLELKNCLNNIDEYLKRLETRIIVKKADAFTIPRIAQLTQKTNQFNMTTKRYLEDDIRRCLLDPRYIVLSAKVEDKFGDNGLNGTMIIEAARDVWIIDTFLLSCRVLGRGIEDALLACLLEQARKTGVKTVIGKFIPTEKNAPAKDFYKKSGFTLAKNENRTEHWERAASMPYQHPKHIALTYE